MDEETDFGLWLRKRRLERGLTQRKLADLSGISRRWLVEIEANRAEPTFSAGLRLIEALAADLADVPGVPRPRTRSGVGPGKLTSEDAEAKRRELLLGSLALLVGSNVVDLERLESLATARHAVHVDATSVRDAEAITALLMGAWYRVAPAGLLPAAMGHLSMLRDGLPGSRELFAVAGWTALLTGHLLHKLDRGGGAYSHYALAESLARDAGDSNLRGMALVLRRGMCSWRTGDARRGLEFLADAEITAGPAAPPLLRTVILATRAEDRAATSDELGCLRDLESAEAALRPSTTHFFGPRAPAELGAIRGTCEALLGRHREAVETFDWVLREMDLALVSWRATVAADRDAVLAKN